MDAVLIRFAVVLVAELGDKSQLMALTFAARYRFWTVLGGVAVATAVLNLLSVTVGALMGAALPRDVVTVAAGLVFLAFGVVALRERRHDEQDGVTSARRGLAPAWLR